jgi:hypothetical protein
MLLPKAHSLTQCNVTGGVAGPTVDDAIPIDRTSRGKFVPGLSSHMYNHFFFLIDALLSEACVLVCLGLVTTSGRKGSTLLVQSPRGIIVIQS